MTKKNGKELTDEELKKENEEIDKDVSEGKREAREGRCKG